MPKEPQRDDDRDVAVAGGCGSPGPKTLTIILASSSELMQDRNAFELHLLEENGDWRTRGLDLIILRWETSLAAMGASRRQETMNHNMRSCDILARPFKTKAGKFAEEF